MLRWRLRLPESWRNKVSLSLPKPLNVVSARHIGQDVFRQCLHTTVCPRLFSMLRIIRTGPGLYAPRCRPFTKIGLSRLFSAQCSTKTFAGLRKFCFRLRSTLLRRVPTILAQLHQSKSEKRLLEYRLKSKMRRAYLRRWPVRRHWPAPAV